MKKKEMPFLAVGNEEIENNPTVKEGDMIKCHICKKKHPLEYGIDKETGEESDLAGFIKCGKETYLMSINGKLLRDNK